MLVCSVSLLRRRAAIAAEIVEAATAMDATVSGQIVFATLVDDPASVIDNLDAYLGEIMVEAASATDAISASVPATFSADVTEVATAVDLLDFVTTSAEVAQFLARTSGLDATHINAYTALIDGLVIDGVWAKLDVLHVYATQNAATALLNLISNSYNGTAVGSPSFTVDRGYQTTNGSSGVYVDTNFNAATASSPKFTQNSASLSCWSLTNPSGSNNAVMGNSATNNINPKTSGNSMAFRVNCSFASGSDTTAETVSTGHYFANRSGASAHQGYKNGAQVVTSTTSSAAVVNSTTYTLATAVNFAGSPFQLAMASIGGSLTSTEVTNFYSRLRTYMTAVGVP